MFVLCLNCSKMYMQMLLNKPFNQPNPWIKEDLVDFHFPNKHGTVEKSLIDDYMMDEIWQLARRSDRRRAAKMASGQGSASPLQTSKSSIASGSTTSVASPQQTPYQSIFGSQSVHSQTSSSSAHSSFHSLGSTASHGSATVAPQG